MQRKIGLREQKKLHVTHTVHQTAVTLFTKQGYDAVSMEDIAKASGISRSTLFRHFATKEATVLHDNLDPILLDTFRNQPTTITAIQALRNTLHDVLLRPSATKESTLHEQRYNLIRAVPQLRIAMLQELAKTSDMLIELVAERAKRPADDSAVCTLANALMGVAVGIVLSSNKKEDYFTRFDQALRQLEAGLVI
jgi:AcrR family transcriptional regulator